MTNVILTLMEKGDNRNKVIFSLLASVLFVRWSWLLLSMDAYLLTDPSSFLFWNIVITRIFLAAFLSLGISTAFLKVGQRFWPISMILIVLSLAGSFFIVPEKLHWAYWIISTAVHAYVLFTLYKNKVLKPQIT